jgi:hypothetical protein
MHDALGRLVDVMLREALRRRCREIQIDVGEDGCAVWLLRGSERLPLDPIPPRLYSDLKDRLARKCGNKSWEGQGTFLACLKRTKASEKDHGDVNVSVVFGDESLRLTITEFKHR